MAASSSNSIQTKMLYMWIYVEANVPSIYALALQMQLPIITHDTAPEALQYTIITPTGLSLNMQAASFVDQMLRVCPQWIASIQVLQYDDSTETYNVIFIDSSGESEQIENIAVHALVQYLLSVHSCSNNALTPAYVITRMHKKTMTSALVQTQRPTTQQSIEFCVCLFFMCTLLWILMRTY
jgi:hypothetical protein